MLVLRGSKELVDLAGHLQQRQCLKGPMPFNQANPIRCQSSRLWIASAKTTIRGGDYPEIQTIAKEATCLKFLNILRLIIWLQKSDTHTKVEKRSANRRIRKSYQTNTITRIY